MESTWNSHYSISKKLLSFIGQWPYQKKRARLFRVCLLTVTVFSMLIPQISQIVQCNGNRQCTVLVIPFLMLTIIMVVKLYTCHLNSDKIKKLVDYLQEDWDELENAEEYEIMKAYAVNARLLALIYFGYIYTISFTFVSSSLIPHIANAILPANKSWSIIKPYEAYYFVDYKEYFFHIFIHLAVSLNIGLVILMAHDCMLLIYTEHVCSLFSIAGFRLENVSCNNDRFDDQKICDQKIANSVYIHRRALRFIDLLEDTFYISFAIQMIIIVIAMSITLLQIALQSEETAVMIKYVSYIMGQLIHLFCNSFQGQKLINHSTQIREKIYQSFWYKIPVKSQKLLLYIMRKSLEPSFLTAGKIYIYSFKSYATVLQSSMSYFTVLSSLQ